MNPFNLSVKYVVYMSVIITGFVLMSGCSNSGNSSTESTSSSTDSADSTTTMNTTPAAATTTVKDGTIVDTTALVALGEALYNDTNLSVPSGQSCASCHTPNAGFDDPDSGDATSLGADGTSIGNRNAPTASYAAHIPDAQVVLIDPPGPAPATLQLVGGQFWDGRAKSLEEQAKGPFLNPVEMANASESDVVEKVKTATYADDFEDLFGAGVLDNVAQSYDYIADAIAAFERSTFFSPFTSIFDQVQNGTAVFTESQARGQALFNGKGQCDRCHNTNGETQVFSNFEYKNIGVPRNPTLLLALGTPGFIDNGLGDVTGDAQDNGKFRTPNLRNVAITAPYMHNGVFTTLTEVVEFYNTRDTTFPDAPEVSQNVDQGGNIGELGLTVDEIQDIVAFLETLTDQ